MEVIFRHDIDKNYMIIQDFIEKESNYKIEMILQNEITGLLNVKQKYQDGKRNCTMIFLQNSLWKCFVAVDLFGEKSRRSYSGFRRLCGKHKRFSFGF
jgi:hypothetical protein